MLAANSPYFTEILEKGKTGKADDEIDIKDIDYDSLFRSIQFIYAHIVPEGSCAKKLLPAAVKLKVFTVY